MSATEDVAIVECGTGNLHSIEKAVRLLAPGAQVRLTSDPEVVARARKVVFPGDGAFDHCMEQIERRGLRNALVDAARTKPFMGICVGMQLLFEHSEEGNAAGLGVLPGRVVRFRPRDGLKVPHMGWNRVSLHSAPEALRDVEDGMRFYFVHSYHVQAAASVTIGSCAHTETFAAIAGQDKLLAVQFHPEKSHRQGLRILKNFLGGGQRGE